MPLTQQLSDEVGEATNHHHLDSRGRRLWRWFSDERGAVGIEYVIVAIALLAIAGAIAAALTTLGDDAVQQIPGSVSEVGS